MMVLPLLRAAVTVAVDVMYAEVIAGTAVLASVPSSCEHLLIVRAALVPTSLVLFMRGSAPGADATEAAVGM
jgi:hypothetical protein